MPLDANTKTALKKYFDAGGKIEFYSPGSYTYRAAPLPPVTADELAKTLRALVRHRDGDGSFAAAHILVATVLLARYDAQKGNL